MVFVTLLISEEQRSSWHGDKNKRFPGQATVLDFFFENFSLPIDILANMYYNVLNIKQWTEPKRSTNAAEQAVGSIEPPVKKSSKIGLGWEEQR